MDTTKQDKNLNTWADFQEALSEISPQEAIEAWKATQRAKRAAGQPCFSKLINPITRKTVATIDDQEEN